MQKEKSKDAIDFCKICFQKINPGLPYFFSSSPTICQKCYLSLNPKWIRWKEGNVNCLAMYEYGEEVKNVLYKFKGCGDVELSTCFFGYQSFILKLLYHGYKIVPAPSSTSHNEKRGFNQVVEMSKVLKMPILNLLIKTKESKQSDLSLAERRKVKKIIDYSRKIDLSREKILFVDDVFTTGSTTRACLDLLKQLRPKRLKCLIMAKAKWRK
ncbi:MAG TPA: hypothetical protein DEF61_05425 [Firmicutes bacterium]|nr:hypothetical protein [Bacillota bacterium]HBM70963.1 hypothetical protein [Bacillota bacterium]HBX25665.1 hypothetical protein [Bacillota bacterium]